jgi:uncharacterized membrane protein YqhA
MLFATIIHIHLCYLTKLLLCGTLCAQSSADVYLAGTVMLIFGMGLYGLFISNASAEVPSESDRALSGSSLFGMFALKVIVGI